MFPLFCAWINGWANNCEAGDLKHHLAYYDVSLLARGCQLATKEFRVKTGSVDGLLPDDSKQAISQEILQIYIVDMHVTIIIIASSPIAQWIRLYTSPLLFIVEGCGGASTGIIFTAEFLCVYEDVGSPHYAVHAMVGGDLLILNWSHKESVARGLDKNGRVVAVNSWQPLDFCSSNQFQVGETLGRGPSQ